MKPNEKEEEIKVRKCENCGRQIFTGDDVLMLCQVVIGIMNEIPLEAKRFFHSEDCFHDYVCNDNGPQIPKRIP